MPRDTEFAPSVLDTVDDVALACDMPIAPDAVRQIDGYLFVRDWPATSVAREGMGAVTITRHDDGAVAMELARYEVETTAYTDRRAIPIGDTTYEALAAALFEPRGEGPTVAAPMTIKSIGTATIDDRRHVNHIITEEVGADGRITLTVEGIATDNIETMTAHEPAVAAYLARKVEIMRRTAWVEGAVVKSGSAAAD